MAAVWFSGSMFYVKRVLSEGGISRWNRIDELILYMSKKLKREGGADDEA